MIAIRKSSGKELSLLGILAVVFAMTMVLAVGATVVSAEEGADPDEGTTGTDVPTTPGTPAVSEEEAVAKIGDIYYKTLVDAFKSATTGDTITLIKDVTDGVGIGIFYHKAVGEEPEYYTINGVTDRVASDITVDFDGHTYIITKDPVGSNEKYRSQGLHLEMGYELTLKNGTLTSDGSVDYKYTDGKLTGAVGVKFLIQNYCDLTLENMILDGSKLVDKVVKDGKLVFSPPYTISNNNGTSVFTDTTIIAHEKGVAFDVCGFNDREGVQYNVDVTVDRNSIIKGNVEVSTNAKPHALGLTIDMSVAFEGELIVDPANDVYSKIATFNVYGYTPTKTADDKITDVKETEFVYTFMVDSTIFDQVSFTRSDIDSKVYPDVPVSTRDHYTYKWDSEGFTLEDKVVTAVYTPIEYTYTFVDDSGERTVTFTVENIEGQIWPEPASKDHYDVAWDSEGFTLEDKVVTAVYTPIEYTVTWVVDGEPTRAAYTIETPLVLPDAPADKLCDYGHVVSRFVGWIDEEGNAPAVGECVGADATYTAEFETVDDVFTVTWTTNKEGYVKTETVACGTVPEPPQYPEFEYKRGYDASIDYWTLDGERVEEVGAVTSDVTYVGVPKYAPWTVSTTIFIDYPIYNSAGNLDIKEVSVDGINLTWGFTVDEIMNAIRADTTAATLIGEYTPVLLKAFYFDLSNRQTLLEDTLPADYTLNWTCSDPEHYVMFTVMCANRDVFTAASSTLMDGGWHDGASDVVLDLGKDNKAHIYVDTWKGLPFYGPAQVTCSDGDVVTITPIENHSYDYEIKGLTAGECDITITVAGFDFTYHVTATGTPAPAPGSNDSSIWPVAIVCLIANAISLFVIIRRNAS